jgi:enamine deaminase RidA (YjgF/YER057c/UK114 family)
VGVPLGAKEPGADLAAQAEIAFQRVVHRVEQAGAAKTDIVKTTVFIKDISPDKVRTAGAALVKVLALETWPASTWVGVTGLVDPRYLIEVEATAVVPAG